MAVDMFIKIKGIDGESKDSKHKGEIDILAWSWGVSNSGGFGTGGGGGAGKCNVQNVSMTKYVDKSSAALMLKASNGAHIPEATLVVRKAGEKPLEYIKYTFKDLLVTSVSTGGSGGEDRLTENVTLAFDEVKFEYQEQQKDGGGKAGGEYSWNVSKNEGS